MDSRQKTTWTNLQRKSPPLQGAPFQTIALLSGLAVGIGMTEDLNDDLDIFWGMTGLPQI